MSPEQIRWNIIVALSTLLAVWLVYRLWRSEEHILFKVTLSVLVFVPILGPAMVLFFGITPPGQPEVFRDLDHRRADVDSRWRHVLGERNPVARFRAWRAMVGKAEDAPNNSLNSDGPDGPRS